MKSNMQKHEKASEKTLAMRKPRRVASTIPKKKKSRKKNYPDPAILIPPVFLIPPS